MPILTRSSTSTVAEAPRPARDQWDGRSPGSRVIAAYRLPDLSLAGQKSVASGKRSPPTVAGAAVGLHRSARAPDVYHIPSSLFRSKEAIKGASTTLRRGVVNGGLLSRLGRCITLAPLSGARPSIELAGETGSRCELLNPGAAPATVCESRRILKSLRPSRRGKTFAGRRRSRVRRPA
jgi:hypothetical protein